MTLHLKIREFCLKHRLLHVGDAILVAVSGGPDSLALLEVLHDLRDEFALRLEVAHLEHGIRGLQAEHDARFVQSCAERLRLPFHLRAINVARRRSSAGRGNLEQLARQERYRFLVETAKARNLTKIATAHTADDQAETVLLWMLRGAGSRGLGAMAPSQPMDLVVGASGAGLTLIRPLLAVSKAEVLQLLAQQKLEYCVDGTNADTGYLRNWLRHDLLPRIARRVGAGVRLHLARTADVLRDEARFLEALAQERFEKLFVKGALSCSELLREPKALQRLILRFWLKSVRGDLRGVGFDHTEAVLELISHGPPQARLSMPGRWQFVREYDTLLLTKSTSQPPLYYCYQLQPEGTLTVPEAGVAIQTERVAWDGAALPDNPLEAIFDCQALTGSLKVRNFRPGDRFRPLGMAGHQKKLKDLFIEKRAPHTARALLPLVVMDTEVLWVPGYGRSEIGRVGPASEQMLRMRLIKTLNLGL